MSDRYDSPESKNTENYAVDQLGTLGSQGEFRSIILANNVAALGTHSLLSISLCFITIIVFPALAILWPLYILVYIWCGYKFLYPTERSYFFSVLMLLLLLVPISLIFVLLMHSRGDEMIFLYSLFNVWSLVMITVVNEVYILTQGNLLYAEGIYPEVPQLLQTASIFAATLMPPLLLMVGMALKKRKLERLY